MEPPLIIDIIGKNHLSVSPNCLLSDAIVKMHENRATCVIVVVDNRPEGIITESDTVGLLVESYQGVCWKELTVKHVMTYPVIAASFDLNVMEAIIIAQGGNIRHIPVTDDKGELVGVANQTELVKALVTYCRQGDLW